MAFKLDVASWKRQASVPHIHSMDVSRGLSIGCLVGDESHYLVTFKASIACVMTSMSPIGQATSIGQASAGHALTVIVDDGIRLLAPEADAPKVRGGRLILMSGEAHPRQSGDVERRSGQGTTPYMSGY